MSDSELQALTEPAGDAVQAFLAAEKARTATEQERRRQSLSARVTAEDLAEVEQQVSEQLDDTAENFDPWLNLLRTLETRAGVKQVYDTDGNREFRVASRYILESVIGVAPEAANYSTASVRLGKLMRRLNWVGPTDLRIGRGRHGLRGRGYRKTDVKETEAAITL